LLEVVPRDVSKLIKNRFGELYVSETRFEDLRSEADEDYLKHVVFNQSNI